MNGKAIIVLLYGTSSSGKTTICSNIHNMCSDLKIESTDSAFKLLEEDSNEKLIKFIDKNKDAFPLLSEVKKTFSDKEIAEGIINEKIIMEKQELPLMFDYDESIFESFLEDFLKKPDYNPEVKKAIINYRKLAINYFDEIYTQVHEEMFSRAINNSKQGVPTILDVVPHPGHNSQFMVDLFQTCLKGKEYTCPTHIALVHCPIHQLSERMHERNRNAMINKDFENVRDKSFPFRQYSQLFGNSNIKSKSIGKLKIEDARKAMAPFCINSDEISTLISQIGFQGEQSINEEMEICSKCDFDQIYSTDFQTSKEIAESIHLIIKQCKK